MNKLPWFKFFPDDWITGTREMSPQEKAAWIDLLAFMWKSDNRGSVSGTWEGIARMLGLPWLDCEIILTGMFRKNYINLTDANGIITLSSRRMEREEKHRESNRIRQKKFYIKKPNANLTRKKSEDRSQKLLIAEKAPQTNQPLTDIQKIVLCYKMVAGYPKEDKAWDKLNFARCTKSAKQLLEFMGNWKDAADCIEDVYEKFTAKGLTVTIETAVKHASEWKMNRSEKMERV